MKKFRTYHKGTMYYSHSDGYPGYLELYNGEWEILIMYESGDHGERIGVDEKDVEQFTGINDKNGKEMYKGDIARQHFVVHGSVDASGYAGIEAEGDHVGEVVILPSKGVCLKNPVCTHEGEGSVKLQMYVNVRCYRSEIIGDIHENISLLDADARGDETDVADLRDKSWERYNELIDSGKIHHADPRGEPK